MIRLTRIRRYFMDLRADAGGERHWHVRRSRLPRLLTGMHARSGPQDGDPALGDGRHNGRSEPRLTERRLLSPEQAAAYLGLRSRFAVYRLVASGQIPALRLANKLRIDLQALELLIEKAKTNDARGPARSAIGAAAARAVPFQLAPLDRHRRAVTRRVTASRDGV